MLTLEQLRELAAKHGIYFSRVCGFVSENCALGVDPAQMLAMVNAAIAAQIPATGTGDGDAA